MQSHGVALHCGVLYCVVAYCVAFGVHPFVMCVGVFRGRLFARIRLAHARTHQGDLHTQGHCQYDHLEYKNSYFALNREIAHKFYR